MPASGLYSSLMRLPAVCLLSFLVVGCGSPPPPSSTAPAAARSTRYEDVLSLFDDWRAFQQPRRANGVPDYSLAAMATQHRDLAGVRESPGRDRSERLADSAAGRLPRRPRGDERARLRSSRAAAVGEQPGVLCHGLPRRERPAGAGGAAAAGGVDSGSTRFHSRRRTRLRSLPAFAIVPGLLEQAKTNLVGHQKDLWTYGTAAIKDQSAALAALASRLRAVRAISRARSISAKAATDTFASWLDSQASSRTESSGIGVDNYNWYLKNVQLVPYTWQDELTLMERELARSSSALVFEEQRHAKLPPQVPIASAAEHDRRFNAAVPSTWRSSRITI